MKMQARMQAVNVELPKKYGISQGVMNQAMQKYSSSPDFIRVMNELQEERKERLAACGVEGMM